MKLKKNQTLRSDIAEPMRSIIQRLSLGMQTKQRRIIAFIAARTREGTSTVAAGYAETLISESDQNVLLIDAGRFPTKKMQRLLGKEGIGLVDAIVAEQSAEDVIHTMGKLSMARWIVQEESRAFASKVLHDKDYWQKLLNRFDSIIIDACSLESSFDGVMLAAKADTVVMVVEAEKTPQPVVKNLHNVLGQTGVDIAGVVMNKRRFYIPKRVYRKL